MGLWGAHTLPHPLALSILFLSSSRLSSLVSTDPTNHTYFSQWRRCTFLRRRFTPANRLQWLQTSRDRLSCRITRWGYSATRRRSLFPSLHHPPLLQDSPCVSPPSKLISAVIAGLFQSLSFLSLSLTYKSSFIIIIIISFYWFTGIYTMTELHSISCLIITSVQVCWLLRMLTSFFFFIGTVFGFERCYNVGCFAVCAAPKRRFRPYMPDVSKNVNDKDVRKARKAELQRDEAVG